MWWRRWFYIREINLDKRRGEYVRRSTENIPPFLTITSWNWKLRFDFATKRRKSCSGTLPLWNRKHRFLQKNNVATVSEEAAVKMKNTHRHREREIERNKKKESEIQISSAFLLFPLSNCSKKQRYMLCQLPQTILSWCMQNTTPHELHT